MQVLKDSIRERIEQSAIKLFREDGFDKVSMRKIANDAHMTVGNIYRYFENKDHLFESLITPTLEKIIGLVNDEVTNDLIDVTDKNNAFVKRIIDIFLDIHKTDTEILDILVYSCEGSKIQKPTETISHLLADRMAVVIATYAETTSYNLNVPFLARMICDSLIDNFIKILYEFDDDDSRKLHMYQITQIYTNLLITTIVNDRKEG